MVFMIFHGQQDTSFWTCLWIHASDLYISLLGKPNALTWENEDMSLIVLKLNKYKILLTTIKGRGPARLFVHTEEIWYKCEVNDYLCARVLKCLRNLSNESAKLHRVHENS